MFFFFHQCWLSLWLWQEAQPSPPTPAQRTRSLCINLNHYILFLLRHQASMEWNLKESSGLSSLWAHWVIFRLTGICNQVHLSERCSLESPFEWTRHSFDPSIILRCPSLATLGDSLGRDWLSYINMLYDDGWPLIALYQACRRWSRPNHQALAGSKWVNLPFALAEITKGGSLAVS